MGNSGCQLGLMADYSTRKPDTLHVIRAFGSNYNARVHLPVLGATVARTPCLLELARTNNPLEPDEPIDHLAASTAYGKVRNLDGPE